MSRLGAKAIDIPGGVQVAVAADEVVVTGKLGKLSVKSHAGLAIEVDDAQKKLKVTNQKAHGAIHGLMRALLANAVKGVSDGFEKKLELQGVGYQASLVKGELKLTVGFANPVLLKVPEGLKCVVPDPTHINVSGVDRQSVGQFAATVRGVRPPEPYKGKGIRYVGEYVRRKAGKAFGAK